MQAKRTNLFWLLVFFLFFPVSLEIAYISSGVISAKELTDTFLLSLIWLLPCLLFPRATKIITLAIGLILLPTALVNLMYFMIYRQQFSEGAFFAIFETTPAEASEYMDQYVTWPRVITAVLYAMVAIFLWTRIRSLQLGGKGRLAMGAAVVLIVFLTLFTSTMLRPLKGKEITAFKMYDKTVSHMSNLPPWGLLIAYYRYGQRLEKMNELLANNKNLPPLGNLKDASGDAPRTLVLILGESTNRERMHLYGYPRPTTPMLDKLAKQGDLTVFSNVVAPRPYTIEIMQQMLTFGDQHNPDGYLTTPSLMNLMNQAGYKTVWITNQQTFSERNNMLTTFAMEADQQYFMNNQKYQNAIQHDEDTFAPFSEALKDPAPKKLIIVHLLGTHTKFDKRYTEAFNVFKDRQHVPDSLDDAQAYTYNSYDNAVLYNDYIVASLINRYQKSQANGFVVYISDHGQEVYDNSQHNREGRTEIDPTRSMYTVPFMIWVSPSWQKSQNLDYSAYVDRPYSSSHFIQTWSDLARLSYDEFIPEQSLVNPQFNDTERWIGDPYSPETLKHFDDLPH